jgi:hypothetical protein
MRNLRDHQLFYARQGATPADAIFLWRFPFFSAAEKPEKSRDCAKIVQHPRTGHLGE